MLVGAGASFSTKDVEDGYRNALKAQGHEVIYYALDGRLSIAASWLCYSWRKHKKAGGTLEKPTSADVLYQASVGVVERALRFMPEWVIVVSGMYFHPDCMIYLRRAGFRVATILTESPYDEDPEGRFIRYSNVAFSNERASVPVLRLQNPHTYYLRHAYDAAKHTPDPIADESEVAAHDVVFVGTAFQERIDTLAAVNWDGIDLGLYGNWQLLGSRSRLRKYVRGGVVDNRTTAALYRKAKIGLNLYRTSKGFGKQAPRIGYAESLNPRALELAACGAFTISDYRAEVSEMFGDAVPTFTSAIGLEQLVREYLQDDDKRNALAACLPELVAGQTYDARARELVQRLEEYGNV
jgi:spore maturation protein CgeB